MVRCRVLPLGSRTTRPALRSLGEVVRLMAT
jgi:hypothetical protein